MRSTQVRDGGPERLSAPQGSNALINLWRVLTAGGSSGVAQRSMLGQLLVTLVPALFIAVLLGNTWQRATAPEAEVDTVGLVQSGGPGGG